MGVYEDDQGNQYVSTRLKWDANSELDLGYYRVEWSRDNADWESMQVDSAATSCRVNGLELGGTYWFRLKAVDQSGNESGYFNFASGSVITMPSDTTGPDAPGSLTTSSLRRSVGLAWTNPTQKDYAHTEVWRSAGSAGPGTKVAEVSGEQWTDELNVVESRWYYDVRAVDDVGNAGSYWSDVSNSGVWQEGYTDTVQPDMPTGLSVGTATVVDADGHIIPVLNVSWTDVSSELLSNGDFEDFAGTADDGTSDNFTSWTEVGTGGGDLIEASSTAHGGAYACKLTNGSNGCAVTQSHVATPGETYKLNFWTRGDGSVGGRYRVTNGVFTWYHDGETGVTGTGWTQLTKYIRIPTGQTPGLQHSLFSPSASGVAWFDDVSVRQVSDVRGYEIEAVFDIDKDGDWSDEEPTTYSVKDSPYRIQPVPGDVSYRVRVRSVDDANLKSAWTAYGTGTTPKDNVAPGTATSLSGVGLYRAIDLTWDNPTDADYATTEVYYKNTSGTAGATLLASVDSEKYTHDGLDVDDTNWYWLKAVDTSGNKSAYASFGSLSTDNDPPPVPAGLAVTPGTDEDEDGHQYSQLACSWNNNAGTVTDFNTHDLRWTIDSAGTQTASTPGTAYLIHPVTANKGYSVQVRSVDRVGNASDWCTASTGTTAKDTQAPGTASGFTTYSRFKSVYLEWENPSDPDLAYMEVWRSAGSAGPGTKLARIDGDTYTDDIGLWDSTWYYNVKGVDHSGNAGSLVNWTVGSTDTTAPTGPSAVTTSTGAAVDADGHVIPWVKVAFGTAAASEDVRGYEVEYQWSPAGTWWEPQATSPTGTAAAGSLSARISPAPGNVGYRARVRAVDDAGLNSAWSSYGTGTTAVDNVAPAAPTVSVSNITSGYRISVTEPTESDWQDIGYYIGNSQPPSTFLGFGRTLSWDHTITIGTYAYIPVYNYVGAKVRDTSGNLSDMGTATITDPTGILVQTYAIEEGAVTGPLIGPSVITTRHMGTISADCIVAGTIDATVINVVKLNADNVWYGTINACTVSASAITVGTLSACTVSANAITVGQLSADRISGGTIDSSVINASQITVGTLTCAVSNLDIVSGPTLSGAAGAAWFDGALHAERFAGGTVDVSKGGISSTGDISVSGGGVLTVSSYGGGHIEGNLESSTIATSCTGGGGLDVGDADYADNAGQVDGVDCAGTANISGWGQGTFTVMLAP